MDFKTQSKLHKTLLRNIKKKLPKLEALLAVVSAHWSYEDPIYRYYHHSFKVYHLQGTTQQIVAMLKSLTPLLPIKKDFDEAQIKVIKNLNTYIIDGNSDFREILNNGTNKKFKLSHNRVWNKHTLPIVQAFFHAKFFLEMAIKYGKILKEAPECLPSGWAALLYFYNLR
jgi:uncharacterized membrane protein YgaE (UPF0421/DUF939 family)